MAKSNFHHQGRSNSSAYDEEKAIKAKTTAQLDKIIADYKADTKPLGEQSKAYLAKIKAERARRIGQKESLETPVDLSLLTELLDLVEFETPGLKLGNLRYDDAENAIFVTIGGQKYKYTPHVAEKIGEIYASVTGMAKHSTGRALAFLKKNATGTKLNEQKLQESASPEEIYQKLLRYKANLEVDDSERCTIDDNDKKLLIGDIKKKMTEGWTDSEIYEYFRLMEYFDDYTTSEDDCLRKQASIRNRVSTRLKATKA